MIHCGAMLLELGGQLYRKLLITSELYRQQQEMYDADSRHIDGRIVNFSKPHVRPIARGKAGRQTEFGAKISISDDNGFVDVDRISWDSYNEANDLIARAKQYKEERGYYPVRICADSIYMTIGNKKFCAENNIRLSGRPRKKQVEVEAEVQTAEQQELIKPDLRKRSVIEGRIGTSKRKYGLDRITTNLIETSRAVITMAFIVMNVEKILRPLRFLFSILVSVYILMLYLFASWRRPALLWAAQWLLGVNRGHQRLPLQAEIAAICAPENPENEIQQALVSRQLQVSQGATRLRVKLPEEIRCGKLAN